MYQCLRWASKRSHTRGKWVTCCGLPLSLTTSSINVCERQTLALEGCTFHTIPYHTIIVTQLNSLKIQNVKFYSLAQILFVFHSLMIVDYPCIAAVLLSLLNAGKPNGMHLHGVNGVLPSWALEFSIADFTPKWCRQIQKCF